MMSDEARKLGLLVPMAANGTNVIPAAFQVAQMPKSDLLGATLIMKSGGAKDQKLSISAAASGAIATASTTTRRLLDDDSLRLLDDLLGIRPQQEALGNQRVGAFLDRGDVFAAGAV
jgi:hypothetical protein